MKYITQEINNEVLKVKGYSKVFSGLAVAKEPCQKDVPEGEEDGLSWQRLPKIYLNLSKSRLTSVSVVVDVVHHVIS